MLSYLVHQDMLHKVSAQEANVLLKCPSGYYEDIL